MLQRREKGRVMMISSTEIMVSNTAQMSGPSLHKAGMWRGSGIFHIKDGHASQNRPFTLSLKVPYVQNLDLNRAGTCYDWFRAQIKKSDSL